MGYYRKGRVRNCDTRVVRREGQEVVSELIVHLICMLRQEK